MSDIDNRLTTYSAVATELALLSDQRLAALLEEATHIGTSIGGTAVSLDICGTQIFVKKIRLTDIERLPENRMSTANLFDLPTFCQYGIGSPGFGAWRELSVHIMSTNWVLAKECPNFPLMYHWRVLPRTMSKPPPLEELNELERDVEYWVEYWGGSRAMRSRIEAIKNASSEIVIFLEYFPDNLNTWFGKQIAEGGDAAELACTMVENNLKAITSFINSRDLLHFDAHFKNILTDGHQLYFTDFGLATSTRFELSEVEAEFYKSHRTYDRSYTATHFVNWLVDTLFGEDNLNTILLEYATGIGARALGPAAASIITRYAPLAIVMNEFYRKLQTEARTTPYPPAAELERLCAAVDLQGLI
ncbi:MAG: serine/threonine protein kinase [Gammaproteobacteria bacterium]|jgi:hypothetical protein|nr:serine/threonine protein kinase [Gammaproteobacteria bacterium]